MNDGRTPPGANAHAALALTLRQFARFALAGLASNAIGYLAYLALTALLLGPKIAMSVVYVAAMTVSFLLNRRWTFGHTGDTRRAFASYVGIYMIGYVINLAGLAYLVDHHGFDHRLVQAGLIVVIAALMFALQKLWIFRDASLSTVASHR